MSTTSHHGAVTKSVLLIRIQMDGQRDNIMMPKADQRQYKRIRDVDSHVSGTPQAESRDHVTALGVATITRHRYYTTVFTGNFSHPPQRFYLLII